MKAAMRVLKRGSPVTASTDSDSITTTAPERLSQTFAIRPVLRTFPSTGIGPNTSIACSPCTSIAGLNWPMEAKGMPPPPTITAKVGSTRWFFSVENASSSVPEPTPRA
jgi:hypothetical protein